MHDPARLESLLLEAARLLEVNGRALAAAGVRDAVQAARTAPTGAARRRRLARIVASENWAPSDQARFNAAERAEAVTNS